MAVPALSFAKSKDYICSITHHTQNADGTISSDFVGDDLRLHDLGNLFSMTIAGQKVESPELKSVEVDGDKALAGKRGDLLFIKMNGMYIMRTENEGYVISACK